MCYRSALRFICGTTFRALTMPVQEQSHKTKNPLNTVVYILNA
ncbi:hypothetical protein CSB90_5447 [Pseudomonas aeruginosa]|nr:hypothetical protein CSB90_5447 [Pseudomonas aeruginosa]